MRHEYKHQITYGDYLIISKRLQYLAKRDTHVQGEGTYQVNSLYFDNDKDKALREKLDGVAKREKFRIRYYNNDTSYIRLEKKSKIYGLCDKQSAPLTKEEVIRLCDHDVTFLADTGNQLLQELYVKMKHQLLRPKTIVIYDREPFVYEPGNVRITFDSHIRTGLYRNRLFTEGEVSIPAAPGVIIMEVKYDAFLPEVMQQAVRVSDRPAAAFSKYAISRIYG